MSSQRSSAEAQPKTLAAVFFNSQTGVLEPIANTDGTTDVSPWGADQASKPMPRPGTFRPDVARIEKRQQQQQARQASASSEAAKADSPSSPNNNNNNNEEQHPLPTPLPYTTINSYHAHIYFDEDNYGKAQLLRRWVMERFPVELGPWNVKPAGPHTSASFYFGFTKELLPIVFPWLQLNSLGLTVLLHPNTGDPRADHLHYAAWINRAQPVNAFNWSSPEDGRGVDTEAIRPNITPTMPLEQ